MKFTVIYPNTQESRNAIFAKIPEWANQMDLEKQGINGGHFRITSDYPPKEVLETFPLNLQVEEVIFKNNKITTIRKQVIDVESESISDTQLIIQVEKPLEIILQENPKLETQNV